MIVLAEAEKKPKGQKFSFYPKKDLPKLVDYVSSNANSVNPEKVRRVLKNKRYY